MKKQKITEIDFIKKQLEDEIKEKNLYMTKFANLILERNQLRDKLANALRYVNASNILKTYIVYKDLINIIEKQQLFKSLKIKGELMLNKYNLDKDLGGSFLPSRSKKSISEIVLWVNYLMDGTFTLDQISEKLNLNKKYLKNLILILLNKKILKKL